MAKIYRVINKTESVSLRKCQYHHRLTNKTYLSVTTVTNISHNYYLQDGGKNHAEQNYVIVTLCIV